MALAPLEEKFWAAFCQAVERPDWIDRQFEPMPQTELIAEVQALINQRASSEWQQLLAEVCNHPQVKARQLVQIQQQPPRADVLFAAWVDGLPPRPRLELSQLSLDQGRSLWNTPPGVDA